MTDIRPFFAATTVFVLLAGCGSSTNTPNPGSPSVAAKPDVIVTIDGKRHACVVALLSEAQGSSVPCGDVIPFIRDELRIPSGSVYDIRTISDVDQAEVAGVDAKLKAAGYRLFDGSRKGR
jgi:hypothetical protein